MNILKDITTDTHCVITNMKEENQRELLNKLRWNNQKVVGIDAEKIMLELQEIKSTLKDKNRLEIIYHEYLTASILLQLLNTDINLNEEQLIFLKQLQIIRYDIIKGSLKEYINNMDLITSADDVLDDICREENCNLSIAVLNGQAIDDIIFQNEINSRLLDQTPHKYIIMTSGNDLFINYEQDCSLVDAKNKTYQIN